MPYPFSEKLNRLIQSRKITVYALAAQSGINRTLIQKMIKGERIPAKRGVVEALAATLMLTPRERSELLESYAAAKVGPDVYERRKAVLDFYNNLPPAPARNTAFSEAVPPPRMEKSGETIYGRAEVLNRLTAVLEAEAMREHGRIRMLAQPEFTDLFHFLTVLCMRRKNLTLDHIVCMENSQGERNALYNLQCLRAMVPLLVSGCTYRPRGYYDSIGGHYGSTSVLPYLILTDRSVMRISYDAGCAVISDQPEYLRLYHTIFDSISEQAVPLSTTFQSLSQEIDFINRQSPAAGDMDCDFSAEPCLLLFLPGDMMRRYLDPGLAADPQQMGTVLKYFGTPFFQNRLRSLGSVYFSAEGMEHFLATGRLSEVPPELYRPLNTKDRFRLLRILYGAALNGTYRPMLANAQKLRIPPCFSTYTFRGKNIIFMYGSPGREQTVFSFSEESIVTTIQDFMDCLPESGLVRTREETLDYLRKLLGSAPAE